MPDGMLVNRCKRQAVWRNAVTHVLCIFLVWPAGVIGFLPAQGVFVWVFRAP